MGGVGTKRGRLERGFRQDGFTLVELMVVVTIIGVLIAIGIPTLLGARDRASDTAAKTRASHALKTQRVAASDAPQQFKTAAELEAEDASLTALPLGSDEPSVLGAVYVRNDSDTVVTLVSRSATGKCFWTRATRDGQSQYAVNDCSLVLPDSAWKNGW